MVQCTLYSVHCTMHINKHRTILTIINGTLIDPLTEIQEITFIIVSTIEVLCFNYRKTVYISKK